MGFNVSSRQNNAMNAYFIFKMQEIASELYNLKIAQDCNKI